MLSDKFENKEFCLSRSCFKRRETHENRHKIHEVNKIMEIEMYINLQYDRNNIEPTFFSNLIRVNRTVISKKSFNFNPATFIPSLKCMSHILKFCITNFLLLIVTALSCVLVR